MKLGTSVTVEVVEVSESEGRSDSEHQCIHCKEAGHDGEHIAWERGPEFGDSATGIYDSTLCDGDVWMCDLHILECADEQRTTRLEVIYGKATSAKILDLGEALKASLESVA